MIWLKRHKLVFVKIPKNASESMAEYLRRYACDDDVFTHDNGFDLNIDDPHRTHSHMDVSYMLRNRLVTTDNRFIAIVRNPLERLLSLYLYRHRQKRYATKISVDDFRERAKRGFIEDHPWHMQLQSTFLDGVSGEYLCYDNLNTHVKELSVRYGFDLDTLPVINKSVKGVNTNDLVKSFYDDATREAANKYWERDIELYNGVKNAENRLDHQSYKTED